MIGNHEQQSPGKSSASLNIASPSSSPDLAPMSDEEFAALAERKQAEARAAKQAAGEASTLSAIIPAGLAVPSVTVTAPTQPRTFRSPYADMAPEQRAERERSIAEARRREEEEERRNTASRMRKASGVPARFGDACLNELGEVPASYRQVAGHLRGLIDQPGMLALVGTRGAGKTWMACALANLFCDQGRLAIYRRATDIFLGLKAAFRNQGPSEREIVSRLANASLLAIDEAQVRSGSDWENTILTDLIDRRYADLRSTVLVSNLTPDAFVASVGESIASRLTETGGILVCDWPSFRDRQANGNSGRRSS